MKTISFWILILLTAVLLYTVVQSVVQHTSSAHVFTFSRFLQEVERGNVKDVTIADQDITGHLKGSGDTFKTAMPTDYPSLIDMLRDKQVLIHRR